MVTEYPGGMSRPINENSEPAHRYGQVLSLSMSRYRLFRAYETPVSSRPLIHGNLRVSWNGLEMQISDSNDARLAAELFGHLRTLC